MSLDGYIHGQLAAAHQRDLLEAAERSRRAAQARQRRARIATFAQISAGTGVLPPVTPSPVQVRPRGAASAR